jgi:alkylhydroperoxidase family enzyme
MRTGDVFPETGNRLPRLERDALDEAGRALFDEAAGDGSSVKGPQGILLRSSRLYGLLRKVNQFLRSEIALDARLRELMILVTAREMGAHHEWAAHAIIGRREGLEDEIIDIVLHRKRLGASASENALSSNSVATSSASSMWDARRTRRPSTSSDLKHW